MNHCLIGDCRESMRTLMAQGVKVQTCVTSPPYFGLRDYGHPGQLGLEPTPDEYVANMVDVFRLVRDLLTDDGTLWLNLGDSYANDGKWGGHTGGKHAAALHGSPIGRNKKYTGLKPKDLIGIPWRVAFALQGDGWYLRQDIIWCLSGGAAVYARTQKGDMPVMVKDLVRLRPETIKLWNGQRWTQVLGWSRSIDTVGAIEIEFRSGERVGCTRGHQWPTGRGLLRADELEVGDVVETTTLPEPDAPKEANALGDDVAWLCGLYLAEGSMSGNTVQLAGHVHETADRLLLIERVTAAFHGSVRVHVKDNTASICIDGPVIASVMRAYIHGNNAKNKGLKVRAWQRGNAWLRRLLDGYLAGDGHYDAANDRWRFGFCRNDRLADDFRTLAARLGLPLRLVATTAVGFGREWPAYRGDIRLTPTAHHNARVGSEIVAVRASRARHFWDIGVADDPHLFALASGVLTHNSKPNPMPESVADRCTKSHEYIFLLSKSERYYYDADAIKEPAAEASLARWQQNIDGQQGSDRVPGKTNGAMKAGGGPRSDKQRGHSSRNKRSVWTVATMPYKGAHFATFPPALIEPCVLAGSRAGDVVFDPFLGSGTTAQVAQALGRRWLGCELNEAYVDLQSQRTSQMCLLCD